MGPAGGVVPYSRSMVWLCTYACPLLCTHCHSESGGRPSRVLPPEKLQGLVDVLLSMQLRTLTFSGGEPLTLPALFEIAQRLKEAGTKVVLYTSGWGLTEDAARKAQGLFTRIHVSMDGPTAETHDRIRQRAGSFARVMSALERLDRHAHADTSFGIDCTITRDTFDRMEPFLTEIAPRFPKMNFASFGAVCAAGRALREPFLSTGFLSDEQIAAMDEPAFTERLQKLAPPAVQVETTSNNALRTGQGCWYLQPDGRVQAMPAYDITVGNILEESPEVLWERCLRLRQDPFVRSTLDGVRSIDDWITAGHSLLRRLGSGERPDTGIGG